MGCSKSMPTRSATLRTTNTTAIFTPTSGWRSAIGLTGLDFNLNVMTVSGNGSVKPAIQYAAVRTNKPDAASAISGGTYQTSTGFTHYRETIGSNSKLLYRTGFMAKNTSGTNQAEVQAEMQVAEQRCAQQFTPVQVEALPSVNTNQEVIAISGWFPTLGADKAKAAFVVTNNNGTNMDYQLMMRSCNDPSAPNSWVSAEASATNPAAGNSERNTGDLSIPAGISAASNQFLQFGLGIAENGSASGAVTATISVNGGVVYA